MFDPLPQVFGEQPSVLPFGGGEPIVPAGFEQDQENTDYRGDSQTGEEVRPVHVVLCTHTIFYCRSLVQFRWRVIR
ncbi:MAG: hypothetical protein P1U75_15520 [Antarcticimicrobium sp.]|uniref:hypothetical protein n=1 Tax=Antarcticimicrobium sp. TaxID=2824147 RepID=UPI00263321A6|nr:hypothetical protein [Antarcticimicrobium sp.]MDF1718064.1 hypothetical protein [Antarcticimicrobium sp.]